MNPGVMMGLTALVLAGWLVNRTRKPAEARRRRPVPLGLLRMMLPMILVGGALLPASAQDKVGPGVREALRTAGEARVIIALKKPPLLMALKQSPSQIALSQIEMTSLAEEVARMQADVLANLSASEYRGKNRYKFVPALAGTILSEAGLAKLVANRNVVKIRLEAGGSGSQLNDAPNIGADPAAAPPVGGGRLSLDLIISRKTYAPGAMIDATLQLRNVWKTPVRLFFSSGARFHITLEDPSGREIWRRSRDKAYVKVIGQEFLKPDAEGQNYEITVPAPEAPGHYILRGWIASGPLALERHFPSTMEAYTGPPLKASVEFDVR